MRFLLISSMLTLTVAGCMPRPQLGHYHEAYRRAENVAENPQQNLRQLDPAADSADATCSINNTLLCNERDIKKLYYSTMQMKGSFQGTLTIKLTIDKRGTVTRCVVIETSLQDAEFIEKIRSMMASWKFGPNNGRKVEVICPLTFSM